mgnify:CR=1 FL=1
MQYSCDSKHLGQALVPLPPDRDHLGCGRALSKASTHHTQGGLPAGVGGSLEHHFGDRILFHLFQGIDPAMDQAIVSFAVVVDGVDADLIVV